MKKKVTNSAHGAYVSEKNIIDALEFLLVKFKRQEVARTKKLF